MVFVEHGYQKHQRSYQCLAILETLDLKFYEPVIASSSLLTNQNTAAPRCGRNRYKVVSTQAGSTETEIQIPLNHYAFIW